MREARFEEQHPWISIEHIGLGADADFLQQRLAAFLLRQESLEAEAVARQTRAYDSRDERRSARQTLHRDAGFSRLASEKEAGVADSGRAGIADERYRLASLQTFDYGCRCAVFVELVMRHQPVLYIEMLKQNARCASVLGKHQICLFQYADGTHRHVFHIAHRSRHNI